MPATKGQTDSTLKIPQTPYLLQVGFTAPQVSVTVRIGVEVHTLNIADGAKLELTMLDGQGATVGTVKGEIRSELYRDLFLVEKANATGLMLAVAELSDYGLKLTGPACKILPQVLIENLKWMDADGAKELETVVRGQKVTLTADVTSGPTEEAIALTITARSEDATAKAGDDGAHAHSHEPLPHVFMYQGRIQAKKIKQSFKAEWEVDARKAKLDFTINLYGVTSKPSKKVSYVAGLNHSG
jgi:hypothetical protein